MKREIHYKQVDSGVLGEFGSNRYELTVGYAHKTGILPPRFIDTKHISLYSRGNIVISPGYQWDGPSGPTLDDSTNMRASLVHDAIYGLLGRKLLGDPKSKQFKSARKKADRLLRVIMREDGAPWWRAWYYYYAVRAFGRQAILQHWKRWKLWKGLRG